MNTDQWLENRTWQWIASLPNVLRDTCRVRARPGDIISGKLPLSPEMFRRDGLGQLMPMYKQLGAHTFMPVVECNRRDVRYWACDICGQLRKEEPEVVFHGPLQGEWV